MDDVQQRRKNARLPRCSAGPVAGRIGPAGDHCGCTGAGTFGLPVTTAREGIPAGLGYVLRQGFTATNAYYTGDPNLYYFLHWEEFVPHNLVRRAGPVSLLESAPDRRVGSVEAETSLGTMPLDRLIADPRSRVQAFIVVRAGEILYEQYPGMLEDDHHLWFSVSKTLAGLLVGLLEAEGKIDVERSIDAYLPEVSATHWSGVRIIDILDMASGLDLAEHEESRTDRSSSVGRFFRIELGDTSDLGQLTSDQILFSVRPKRAAGEVFEYSSLNSKMLGLLAERVSGKRAADLLSERVWGLMGAEGDGQVGVNLEGGAAIYTKARSRRAASSIRRRKNAAIRGNGTLSGRTATCSRAVRGGKDSTFHPTATWWLPGFRRPPSPGG